MTRTKIVAAGIAMAAVLIGGPAPSAFAYGWPGAGMLQHYEPEIPAGALPPGAAVAEMNGLSNRYRVRFEMPAAGPAHLSMWGDIRAGLPEQDVVVRSDSGATFRTTVESSHDTGGGPPLFLGSADQLAAFSRAASEPSSEKDLTEGIALGARSELAAPDCRRLAQARYVVAVLKRDDEASGLLTCAARGAKLLVIGEWRHAPGAGADAFAAHATGTQAVAWGFGAVAGLPNLGADPGQVIAQLEAAGRSAGLEAMLTGVYRGVLIGMDAGTPKGIPGSTLVLVLLALYVAVIGPVGYFVGVRPRRAWLAWSWFPMVALAATVALTVGSTLWRGKSAELAINRVSIIAPTGVGLEAASARLQGSSSARFSISLPWRDGDLRDLERGYRFGTPFASPTGSLAVTDDRIAGRLVVDGLAVGRYGTADVGWVGPVERGGAEVAWRGRELTIVNRGPRPLRRVLVSVGMAGVCGTIEDLPAGNARTVAARDCDALEPDGTDPAREWRTVTMAREPGHHPGSGSFMLTAETDEPFAGVVSRPAVAPPRTHDIVVVRGPFSGPGATP